MFDTPAIERGPVITAVMKAGCPAGISTLRTAAAGGYPLVRATQAARLSYAKLS